MTIKRKILVFVAVVAAFFICVPIYKKIDEIREAAVAQKQFDELVLPVVRIKGGVDLPDGRHARWTGSGVVVFSKPNSSAFGFTTYVLTCNHVVEKPVFSEDIPLPVGPWGPPPKIERFIYGVDYVELFNADGTSRKVQGYVVAQSNNNLFEINKDGDLMVKANGDDKFGYKPGEDLALVRLETVEKIPTVKMMAREDISKLRRFFPARVVGCSLGGRPYNTVGEITVLQGDYMSVSAQFVPGNSGGAAYLDKTHEFLGVTNAGPNGVWHMGLIRPLYRIYDWLESIDHAFIFDPEVAAEKRESILIRDNDLHIADLKIEKDALTKQVQTLSRVLKRLALQVQESQSRIEDLQKEVDLLLEKVATLESLKEKILQVAGQLLTGNCNVFLPPPGDKKSPVQPKTPRDSYPSSPQFLPPRR
jgi:hypothetical protein